MIIQVPLRILGSLTLALVCTGGLFAATPQAHAASPFRSVHAQPLAHQGVIRIHPDPSGHPWLCTPAACVPQILPDPAGPNW